MLKGGVIMDVTTPEEARIAEEAGAVAVMALERVPADIRKDGGIARMSDASVIKAIKQAVTIPVMAKARIGHFVEAQILEALDVDYIDESEVRQQWWWWGSGRACNLYPCCSTCESTVAAGILAAVDWSAVAAVKQTHAEAFQPAGALGTLTRQGAF